MKFKVGDHVIGNKKACIYGITNSGWKGEVVKVDSDIIYVHALPGFKGDIDFGVDPDRFDLLPGDTVRQKIVVTSDGATTTARLYDGNTVLKSAEAKCLPRDVFDFKTGAALAVDRLLGRDAKATEPAPSAEPFSPTYLSPGRFGYTNRNKWFIVVENRLVYVENGSGWDGIADLNADGAFKSGHRIEFVVDAYSLGTAKYRDRTGNYIWHRNK